MNAINRATSSIFDVLLTPFELLGPEMSLILASGLFGILALLIFKQISWQAGIKQTKDKIKGHMIAIRLYQDDLAVVGASVAKVLVRNVQYLSLNILPILPLVPPFMLFAGQLVARYAFDPLPVAESVEAAERGERTTLQITFKRDHRDQIADMEVQLPEGLVASSKLVRSAREGRAFVELVATAPVQGDIRLLIGGQEVGSKAVVAGDEPTRMMQFERVSSFWLSWIRPAEPTFGERSPVEHMTFVYPDRQLRFLPGGEMGVVLVLFVASMVFGVAILKPLNIQI